MHESSFSSPLDDAPDILPADDATLAEYFAGTAAPADRERIDAWARRSEVHAEQLERLSTIWAMAERPAPLGNADAFVSTVLAKITQQSPSESQPVRTRRPDRRRWWMYGTVAATLLVGVALGVQRWFPTASGPAAPATIQTYATAAAQQSVIALPDGSSATLAPLTELQYRVRDNGEREVVLSGQALFEVAPNTRHPFLVKAGGTTTRVLGTAFTIEHYPGDTSVSVAVLSGKVATGGTGIPVTLIAGMAAVVRDSVSTVITPPNINSYIEWTGGRLVFNDVPVPQLLATMSRWYGYQFQLRDSALSARYATATFNIDDPEETMLALSRLLGVTLDVQDSVIVLHPRSKSSQNNSAPIRRADPQHSLLPDLELGR